MWCMLKLVSCYCCLLINAVMWLQSFEAPFMMSNASADKELLPSPYDPK